MAASRATSRPRPASRSRMDFDQSGMLGLRDSLDRLDEGAPGVALRPQHPSPGRRQTVVAAPALRGFLDPPAFDPSALLEAVEEGIQGRHVEAQRSLGATLDELADFVTVAGS